jgi:hypothetical protein
MKQKPTDGTLLTNLVTRMLQNLATNCPKRPGKPDLHDTVQNWIGSNHRADTMRSSN